MIYDFGLAKKLNPQSQRQLFEDYRRVLFAFRNISEGGWISIKDLPRQTVSYSINNIKNILFDIIAKNYNEDTAFTDYIIPAFLACSITDIFVDTLPKGTVVANKQPFVIDSQHINVTLLNPLSAS
jgi:hypothetical protein